MLDPPTGPLSFSTSKPSPLCIQNHLFFERGRTTSRASLGTLTNVGCPLPHLRNSSSLVPKELLESSSAGLSSCLQLPLQPTHIPAGLTTREHGKPPWHGSDSLCRRLPGVRSELGTPVLPRRATGPSPRHLCSGWPCAACRGGRGPYVCPAMLGKDEGMLASGGRQIKRLCLVNHNVFSSCLEFHSLTKSQVSQNAKQLTERFLDPSIACSRNVIFILFVISSTFTSFPYTH